MPSAGRRSPETEGSDMLSRPQIQHSFAGGCGALHGLPYFTWAMSPTVMSATGIWMTWLPRMTVNFCSCSIRLCKPRNCFSLLQSLKAVTNTTHTTDRRIAAPSIHPVSPSPSSSPTETSPQTICKETKWQFQKPSDYFQVFYFINFTRTFEDHWTQPLYKGS